MGRKLLPIVVIGLVVAITLIVSCSAPALTAPHPSMPTPTPTPALPTPTPTPIPSTQPVTLEQLNTLYPELYQELLRLPELNQMGDKENKAIEKIGRLALDSKYKAAFESILNEGIKEKRKYCTPLQALLWIAYDRKIDADNLLQSYSLSRLMNDAWRNTTTSKNYTSVRWADFSEVVDRLNSPSLVNLWVFDNLKFDMGRLKNVGDPTTTFRLKVGVCRHYAMFATECLLRGGYQVKDLTVTWGGNEGHTVSVMDKDNKLWIVMDSTMTTIQGPYDTYDEIANSLIARLAPTRKISNIYVEDNGQVIDRNASVFGLDP